MGGETDIATEAGGLLAEESTGWCTCPREGVKQGRGNGPQPARSGGGGTPRVIGTFQNNRAGQMDCKRETGGPGVMLLGEANTIGVYRHMERVTAWEWGCVSTQKTTHAEATARRREKRDYRT